jgi:hypothetical protein
MKQISFIFCFSFIVINGFTQSDSIKMSSRKFEKSPHYVGFCAGFTNGLGLSYAWWPQKTGIQITAMPLYRSDAYSWDERFKYSVGLTLLRELGALKYSRFYVYIGNHITNFNSQDEARYSIGIGPGIEVGDRNFKFHFSFGYACYDVLGDLSILPTAETGVYFNFGNSKNVIKK